MSIDYNKIEAFIKGDLSTEEAESIASEMRSDPQFESEVNFHKHILEGIEVYGNSAFEDIVQEVDESLDRKGFFADKEELDIISGIEAKAEQDFIEAISSVDKELANGQFFENKEHRKNRHEAKILGIGIKRFMAIAATFLVIISATLLLWPKSDSLESIYFDNFAALPENLSQQVEIERSEIGFAEPGTADPLSELEDAMTLYNAGEFDQFLNSSKDLLAIPAISHYRNQLMLFQGIALMSTGEYETALNKFNTISQTTPEKLWYQSLVLIKLKRTGEAKVLLLDLESNYPKYSEIAERVLRRLT